MVNVGTPENDRARTHQEREELLYDLLECWSRVGDMRLGQLLCNAVNARLTRETAGGLAGRLTAADRDHYLFYAEDRVILAALREFVRNQYPLAGESATSS